MADRRARGHQAAFRPGRPRSPPRRDPGRRRRSSCRRARASTRRGEFLATAAATPFIRGVVGWVDLTDPAIGDVIAALRAGPGGDRLVGIRHQVHDEPDPEWLARDDVRRGIRGGRAMPALPTTCSSVRASCRPRARSSRRCPMRVSSSTTWRSRRSEPARSSRGPTSSAHSADLPNAAWKLSGLVTEADWEDWTASMIWCPMSTTPSAPSGRIG